MNSTEPSLETIHFDIFSIKDLNVLLYHDLKALSKISPDSYSIFIGFKANEQIHNFRILAEETSTEETSTSSENSTTTLINLPNSDATNPTLRIMPYVMTGYLFTLLALFVVLVGAMALCSVQAPDKFPRLPLLVGRESN